MFAWYDVGYFADDLEIACGENSMFLPLKNYKEVNKQYSSTSNSTPNHIYNPAEQAYN